MPETPKTQAKAPAFASPKTYTDVGFDQEKAAELATLGSAYVGKVEYQTRFVPLNARAKSLGEARTAVGKLRVHNDGQAETEPGHFTSADEEQAYKLLDSQYGAIINEIDSLAVTADARDLANKYRPWAAMRDQLADMGIPRERIDVVVNLVNLYDATPDPETFRVTASKQDSAARPLHWQFMLGDGTVVSRDAHNLTDTPKDYTKMSTDILAAFRKYGNGLEDAISQGARNWPKNTLENGTGEVRYQPMTIIDPRTNEVVVKVWLDRPTGS